MISINLLKPLSGRPGKTGGRHNLFFRALIVAAIGVAIIIAGVEIMHLWLAAPYRLPAITWREVETEVTGPVDTASETPKPRDVTAAPASARADITRNETVKAKPPAGSAPAVVAAGLEKAVPGAGEKTAYEIAFADRVFSTLAGVIPDDIEFTAISLDSFARLSMAGQSPNRESLGRLFSGLPQGDFQLDPPPRSFITSAANAHYRFHLESRVSFHGRPSDTAERAAHPVNGPGYGEQVSSEVSAFSGLLKWNGLTMSKPPSRVSEETSGEYPRSRYFLAGYGTLPDLVAFIRAAHEARLPCAFRNLHLRAAGDGKVSIDADVDFITRH